jgi:nucleoid-associated protein YgaU
MTEEPAFNNPSPDPTVQDAEGTTPPPSPDAAEKPLSAGERVELEQLRAERQAAAAGPATGLATPVGTPGGATTPGTPPPFTTVPGGGAPPNRPALNDGGKYVVQPGDSLPLIAERFGHSGEWRELHFANFREIFDPAAIAPGQELAVPPEWVE